MRSQTTKPLPKKGALGKTNSPNKQNKKRVTSNKKLKLLVSKNVIKSPRKKVDTSNKNDGESSSDSDKPETSAESSKTSLSKSNSARSESPTKKPKKDNKEKKDTIKATAKKVAPKKPVKLTKKQKLVQKSNAKKTEDNDDVKYKINLEMVKNAKSKFSKAKLLVKKGKVSKKKSLSNKQECSQSEVEKGDDGENKHVEDQLLDQTKDCESKVENNDKQEKPENNLDLQNETVHSNSTVVHQQSPKTEVERPPKFFTSSRSPRTVDIDIKCSKNSKGNLSVSERFISTKCETVSEDSSKEKNISNTLVSQGPDFDVYTFSEKVDSPKSILSDFRNPVNKNVGRVRPIARVKGTIIDKKTESEKKKYSPHRPIEEVVKQLKASKTSEDINTSQSTTSPSGLDFCFSDIPKESEDKPKPIVSKSYKMVARKSSVTGIPFSAIKFEDKDLTTKNEKTSNKVKKPSPTSKSNKKQQKSEDDSDDEFSTSKFSFNSKTFHYSSSDESVSESNDDNESKECSETETKNKKSKNKRYKRITDSAKKNTSKELKELSKDSLIDLKDESTSCNEKASKRHLKLLSMWNGPKRHRMASLNAIAKVHCLYENESRTHMELGLMKTVDRHIIPSTSKSIALKKKEAKTREAEKDSSNSESDYDGKSEKKNSSSESSDEHPPQRSLRGEPGIRSAGKYWDPKSSTSSSEESEMETKRKVTPEKKKTLNKTSSMKSDSDKPPAKMKKTAGVPVKKKRNRAEIVMDLKDMVVQKRMASLNATAILAASYEKRSPKSSKDDTTSDSCSDESFSHKPKNGVSSGVKSEVKNEETKKECDEGVVADRKQKVEVIVNDTDVTITGVYATHHEGFCTVSGMQYRISATSHTQTTATANCEKEGCSRDDGARYTPLTALSSMQPPAEHPPPHTHGVPELGGLARRAAGCSSAFSPPSPSAHHEPGKHPAMCTLCEESSSCMPSYGYYQPAGPLIKESGADAERALARYHPPPHYHAHPPVLPQYNSYYPPDLCYGRYYRPPGPYHMTPPQPDGQMVGVGGEPYPPPQYYGTPPCYQHSPQRIPYVGCSCPSMNAYPKNVHIGPATGKAPTGGGPADVPSALAAPGAAFRPKVRACALDAVADTHGSGKDPPLGPEPSAAADAPDPCSIPAIGSASPKREFLDVRDNLRLLEVPGRESIGPPSPARGSAGVCAPQPPPVQRRARLGKAMARRTLVGDNTDLLLSTPRRQQEPDDDVLAISPPLNVPIDLSSSDERSTPLVDVKKENEGPTNASTRKTDALALREQNTTTSPIESDNLSNAAKTVKRRYSRTKLEIDMKDTQLEDTCKTNGIGEHVKLQKRRKVSGDQTEMRLEPVTREPRKRTTSKKQPKTPTTEKRIVKRKIDSSEKGPNAKRMLCETLTDSNPRLINVAAVPDVLSKPKTKSALLLDNLIRKNSIDGKGYVSGKEINPADLFLTPLDNSAQNKRTLNNNNNIVDNKVTSNGVRQNTIAAVSQHIEKKLASKNACKLEKIDSKITFNSKSVLKPQTENNKKEEIKTSMCELKDERSGSLVLGKGDTKCVDSTNVSCLPLRQDNCNENIISKEFKNNLNDISLKASKLKSNSIKLEDNIEKLSNESQPAIIKSLTNFDFDAKDKCEIKAIKKSNTVKVPTKRCNRIDSNGELKSKNVERVIKLLASKKPGKETESSIVEEKCTKDVSDSIESDLSSIPKRPQFTTKNGESKFANIDKVVKLLAKKPTSDIVALVGDEVENEKLCNMPKLTKDDERINEDVNKMPIKRSKVEKVAKLLVSKKLAIKTDEASLVVEDACASPVPHARRRRRRSGAGVRRPRRVPAPLALPALEHRNPPRWSNGWNWDGENYISKVYLNNDSRLDRSARCWPRMVHASGDRVARGDCVLLRASVAKAQPFVARVASLWENPEDGEMMVSLVWYYRPEHTDLGRQPGDAHDEVFASRHRDANSVACIEDKCYVLTFNEYCRYRKRLKAAEEGITVAPSIVPPLPASEVTPLVAPNDSKLPPSVSPELVLFCRKVYDFRSKKIQVPNK